MAMKRIGRSVGEGGGDGDSDGCLFWRSVFAMV